MREKLTGGTLRVVMVLKPTNTTSPFMQGFCYFRDDSIVDPETNTGLNLNQSTEHLTDFHRDEPTCGKVNYTLLSLHTLVAKRLDLTARYIYSNAKSNSVFSEGF